VIALTLALCMLLARSAVGAEPVVPPGQDALMAAMFGAGIVLPGPCAFVDGVANGPVIRATYQCPTGPVVFGLTHVSAASDGAIQTARFAITLAAGSPPGELVDALVWLVGSRESAFQWVANDDGADRGAEQPES